MGDQRGTRGHGDKVCHLWCVPEVKRYHRVPPISMESFADASGAPTAVATWSHIYFFLPAFCPLPCDRQSQQPIPRVPLSPGTCHILMLLPHYRPKRKKADALITPL